MANLGSGFVKIVLLVFNFIFFILGLAIIIGAGIAFANYDDYQTYTGNMGTAVLITFISVGVFIFVTGFFGCCGAWKESRCMLLTYSTIIVFLLLIEVSAGIAGYVMRDDISKEIDSNMAHALAIYPTESPIYQESFDDMQQSLKCCGTVNYMDWFGVYSNATNAVPLSCCKDESKCKHTDVSTDPKVAGHDIYTDGCAQKLKDTLQDNMLTIIIVCVSIGVVEIIIIFFACCLSKSKGDSYETV